MDTPEGINTSKITDGKRDYLNIPPIPKTVWSNPLHFIAFGFGSGTIPFAPGTFGTLIAIPFYLMMEPLPVWLYALITFLLTLGSIYVCDKTSRDINIEDHQGMCLDEVIGFLVTMIGAPAGWIWIAMGFVFFRLFDIVKPWPIRTIDARLTGGLGMILDDVLAGLMSCVLLQIIKLFVL